MKPPTPDNFPELVLECVRLYPSPDKRVTKKSIAWYCRMEYNQTTDRQIRDAVSILRKDGQPIISDSGHAGYYYDPQAVDSIIADMESRIIEMSETVKALRRGVPGEVRQLELV